MTTTKRPKVKPAIEVGPARVVKLGEQEEWRSTCGMRRDLVDVSADEPVWFHYMRISDSRKHSHARTIEYYYVTEGVGEMELGDEVIPIAKGDMIIVPPGTPHTSRPTTDAELHVLIVVVPPPGSAEHEMEMFHD
jgi:mannose-6-phosphate isomerase-like protein (cupin superfamily)